MFHFSTKQLYFTVALLASLLLNNGVSAQTFFDLSTGNYAQNFSDITNWTNNFAAGVGASNYASVGVIGSGSAVNTGVRTTKSSATFVTSTSGGLQKGSGALLFLSTGSSATPEAVAVDLLMNFTNRIAGTLSFDWAAIDNSNGTRPTSLRVFYSTDGTTFTEITGAQVLDKESANAPASGNVSVSLPSALNGVANVRIRFYNHAGTTATGSGNRDRMQLDNVSITSVASIPDISTNGTTALTFSSQSPLTQSTSQTFNISGVNLSPLAGNITMTAPNTDFQVSSDNTSWAATATIAYTGGALATTPVYVRFTPQTAGAKSGNVTFSGGSISTTPSVAVSGFSPMPSAATVAATDVSCTSFTANWNAVSGATGYFLDVYSSVTNTTTTETFTGIAGGTSSSYLTRTWTGAGGISWSAFKARIDQTINAGNAAITLRDEAGAYLESGAISGNPSNVSFSVQQKFTGSGGQLTLKILSGAGFATETTIGTYPYSTTTSVINAPITGIAGPFKIRIDNNTAARPCIDDLAFSYSNITYAAGFENLAVSGTSQAVTGLTAGVLYNYVVRATNGAAVSGNSNITSLTTTPLSTFYADNDMDGFGATTPIMACTQPANTVIDNNTDCNDNAANAYPGADELCGSMVDLNCDGLTGASPSASAPLLISQTVAGTTATLTWSVNCVYRHRIQVQEVGTTNWKYYYTYGSVNTINIPGLVSGKSYRWSVRGQGVAGGSYSNPMATPVVFMVP